MPKDKEKNETLINAGLGAGDAILSLFSPVTGLQTIKSVKDWYGQRKERAFDENLKAFLRETESVTEREKNHFLEKLNEDQENFFYRILRILDKTDERERATYFGRLFTGYVKGEMESVHFQRLCLILESIFLDDLVLLRIASKKPTLVIEDNRIVNTKYSQINSKTAPFKRLVNHEIFYEPDEPLGGGFTDKVEITNIGQILSKYI